MKSITLNLQRLGKRKINTVKIESDTPISTLKALLTTCVSSEVDQYNDKRNDLKLIAFLTPKEILGITSFAF